MQHEPFSTLNSAQPNQMKRNGKSTPWSSIVRLEEVGGSDMSFAEMPASTSIRSHLTIHVGKIKADFNTLHWVQQNAVGNQILISTASNPPPNTLWIYDQSKSRSEVAFFLKSNRSPQPSNPGLSDTLCSRSRARS